MLNKKIFISVIFIFLILIFSFFYFIQSSYTYKEQTRSFICNKFIPGFLDFTLNLLESNAFQGKEFCNNLYNDYNVKYLPETQYANFDFKIFNLNNNYNYNKFYLENFQNNLILTEEFGKIQYAKNNFSKTKDKFNYNFLNINSNTDSIIKNGRILDTLINDNTLYISYFSDDKCKKMGISFAKINFQKLEFNELITFNECKSGDSAMSGGRLQYYDNQNTKGLLLTTSMNDKKGNNVKAQEDNSIYGKILFIDLNNLDYKVFAKGFRNPQGLYVDDDLILTSEHGPRGGDEINNIIMNGNYGWPISSYGEPYGDGFKNRNKDYLLENLYKKNHNKYGFIEPVYSFIPSIGASELIKLPNNFHPKWEDNFLLSSLSGHSLFRLMFSNDFSRVIYSEKIYIGYRTRDLKYDPLNNVILLAMENFGQIGILIPETN